MQFALIGSNAVSIMEGEHVELCLNLKEPAGSSLETNIIVIAARTQPTDGTFAYNLIITFTNSYPFLNVTFVSKK